MTALRILFEHRDAVPFFIVNETAVPIFERGEKRIASVLFIALCRAERNKGAEVFEVLLIEALEPLLVEIVPFLEILEPGTFVLDNKVGVGGAERIPHANFFVEVAFVSVLYRVLDDFADLLFKAD